ncbi:hypothetical protein Tco_0199287 [Tanacetum coccineum]
MEEHNLIETVCYYGNVKEAILLHNALSRRTKDADDSEDCIHEEDAYINPNEVIRVPTHTKKKDAPPKRSRTINSDDNVLFDSDEATEYATQLSIDEHQQQEKESRTKHRHSGINIQKLVNKEVDEGYKHKKVKLKAKENLMLKTVGSKRKFEDDTYEDDVTSTFSKGKKKKKCKSSSKKSDGKKRKVKDKVRKSIRTRTTPTSLFSAMCILNPDRKKCIRDMGFGSMIGMAIHELPGVLGLYVMKNLDTEKNELLLSDSSILVNSQSVHDILGIPISGRSIESLEPRSHDDPFIREWKSQFGDKSTIWFLCLSLALTIIESASHLVLNQHHALYVAYRMQNILPVKGEAASSSLEFIHRSYEYEENGICLIEEISFKENKWLSDINHPRQRARIPFSQITLLGDQHCKTSCDVLEADNGKTKHRKEIPDDINKCNRFP